MKISYIWVDNYKGFIKQGFNFSSKEKFAYDPLTSVLHKRDNPNYIENFFSHQIIDITGIIGKNASGKSNILELIQYVSDGANTIINRPFFLVIGDEKVFTILTYKFPDIICDFKVIRQEYEGKIPETNSIFFSNIFDGRRHNFHKRIIDISTNNLLNSQFGENINKNYQKTIQNQIQFIKSSHFELLENIEQEINPDQQVKLKPEKVILSSPIWSNIKNRIQTFETKLNKEYSAKYNLTEFVKSFRKKITSNKSIQAIKYQTAFIVFIDFILNRELLGDLKKKISKAEKNTIDKLLTPLNEDLRIDEVYRYLTNDFAFQIDANFNASETFKFLKDLDGYEFESSLDEDFKEDVGTYASRRVQFTLNYDDKVGNFLKHYLDAITNQNLTYSIEWSGISSGHKAYINLFSNFHSTLKKVKEETLFISIDEGDLYFHPKWQTEFLYKLIKVLPELYNKRIQIFLTTHSPFLVSDLPKSNLLFTEKDANDNLRVLPTEQVQGETFGGNIGELYLDAFFMSGKLVSQFAYSKIKGVVDKIKKQQPITTDDRKLIDQIGEDLIKIQIKKLLDDTN